MPNTQKVTKEETSITISESELLTMTMFNVMTKKKLN